MSRTLNPSRDPQSEPASPAEKWHWPRYRLRTLLVLVLVYCVLLTWYGIRWRWQEAQQEILRSLDRFGPSVVSSGGDVVVLSLEGTEIRDGDLRNVGKLSSLEVL